MPGSHGHEDDAGRPSESVAPEQLQAQLAARYTLEYTIPWTLLRASRRPPQPGDVLGAKWTVHWSDREGRISRGHLVEITYP